MGGGVVFLFLAFMVGLPMLIVSPSKFALCFTLGCCSILAGFAALKGWRAQLSHMLSGERLPFSAGEVAAQLGQGGSSRACELQQDQRVDARACSRAAAWC
jgi:hypothetical protein